jgi:putative sigma-54 modulation protein
VIVDIHGQGFTVTPALAEHVRRRLGFVLTRHTDRIQRVAVRVGDEIGPRGGVDKFCRIQVHLTDVPVAVILDVGVDLYAVIVRAADRVGRIVAKRIDRTHPVRDTERHGSRPGRNRGEPLRSDLANGDTE